jgi:hypothetical protein
MTKYDKVLGAVQELIDFCNEQQRCQNCIFREFGADSWKCHIDAFDLREVLSNIEAKRKRGGYL